VHCIVGVGEPTAVRYEYDQEWPGSMDEEARVTETMDGDTTVPAISMTSVCQAWHHQQACYAPLAAARSFKFGAGANTATPNFAVPHAGGARPGAAGCKRPCGRRGHVREDHRALVQAARHVEQGWAGGV